MAAIPKIGEVWFVDFGYEDKPRYALVVGCAPNARLAIASTVKITTQFAGTPFEVTLPRVPWLREQSYVNAQSIQPVKFVELVHKAPGQFDAKVFEEVRAAVKRWLEL